MIHSAAPIIDVIIPAHNEEESIHKVLKEIPRDLVRHMIVCNNRSTDRTALRAHQEGAVVIDAPIYGYGSACLKGMEFIESLSKAPDIVVFLDGDYSDYPEQMTNMIDHMLEGSYDLVIGSRVHGRLESGAMKPQQIFGNWLATHLIRWFYKVEFTDLGPFRAIRYESLLSLEMEDPNFGWTVEMQVKAAKAGLKCSEIPVDYRRRIGRSKVSGTIKGTVLAGHKILWTIFRLL